MHLGPKEFVSVAADDSEVDEMPMGSNVPGPPAPSSVVILDDQSETVEEMLLQIARMDENEQENYLLSLPEESHDALLKTIAAMGLDDTPSEEAGGEKASETELGLLAGGVESEGEKRPIILPQQPGPALLSEPITGRTASGHMSQSGPLPILHSAVDHLRAPPSDGVHITLAAGRDLPRKDISFGLDGAVIDPYVCISLIETSGAHFNTEDLSELDHEISISTFANLNRSTGPGRGKGGEEKPRALTKVRALWTSQVVEKQAFPSWDEVQILRQAFLAADLLDPLDLRRPAVPKAKVKGQKLLVLLTVHDKDLFNEDEFVGRVIIPLTCGERVSDWFVLEDKDGSHVRGESGANSMIQLHIEYKGPQTAPSVLQKAPSDDTRQQDSEHKKCIPGGGSQRDEESEASTFASAPPASTHEPDGRKAASRDRLASLDDEDGCSQPAATCSSQPAATLPLLQAARLTRAVHHGAHPAHASAGHDVFQDHQAAGLIDHGGDTDVKNETRRKTTGQRMQADSDSARTTTLESAERDEDVSQLVVEPERGGGRGSGGGGDWANCIRGGSEGEVGVARSVNFESPSDKISTESKWQHICSQPVSLPHRSIPFRDMEAGSKSARGEGSPATPGRVQHRIKIEVVGARYLPTSVHSASGRPRKPNALVCVTLIAEPHLLQDEHFVQLGHAVREDGGTNRKRSCHEYCGDDDNFDDNDAKAMLLFPQEITHTVKEQSSPSWNTALVLSKAYPDIIAIEAAAARNQLSTLGQAGVELNGSPVMMLITVQDAASDDDLYPIGKVLVPFVVAGTCVDQWFVLQDRQGTPLRSHAILPPALRLRVHYATVGNPTISPDVSASFSPFVQPPSSSSVLIRTPSASFSSPGSMSSPRESQRAGKTNVFGPAPACLRVAIMDVQHVAVPDDLSQARYEVQVFVNVLDVSEEEEWGAGMLCGIEHAVSEVQERELRGYNFAATPRKPFLLRPQCATSCRFLNGGSARWDDDLVLYNAFPSVHALSMGRNDKNQTMLERQIVLKGQPVVIFMTLQLCYQDQFLQIATTAFRSEVVTSNGEFWHPLYLMSGAAMTDRKGRPAMIRVDLRYTRPALGADLSGPAMQMSPSGRITRATKSMFEHTMPFTVRGETAAPAATPATANALSARVITPKPCMGKLYVRIFEGRNFASLRMPQAGCKILCEIILQGHTSENKVARTRSIPDVTDPDFGGAESCFQVHSAAIAATVLKVNVVLVTNKGTKSVGRIGKVRRIKLHDVAHHGQVSAWFDIHCNSSSSKAHPSVSRARSTDCNPTARSDAGQGSRSPFQTLKDQRHHRSSGAAADACRDEILADVVMPALGRSPVRQNPSNSTPHHKAVPSLYESFPDLEAESESAVHTMTVDMLLSQDESLNDRMLREEIRGNDDKKRLQLERRLHPTQSTTDGAAIRMHISYVPPERTPFKHIVSASSASHLSSAAASPPNDSVVVSPKVLNLNLSNRSHAPSPPKRRAAGQQELKIGGVGVRFAVGPEREHVVDHLVAGGPVDISGKVLPGDILVGVEGQQVATRPIVEVQQLLRGDVGSPVAMAFTRGAAQIMVTVTRQNLKSLAGPPRARQTRHAPAAAADAAQGEGGREGGRQTVLTSGHVGVAVTGGDSRAQINGGRGSGGEGVDGAARSDAIAAARQRSSPIVVEGSVLSPRHRPVAQVSREDLTLARLELASQEASAVRTPSKTRDPQTSYWSAPWSQGGGAVGNGVDGEAKCIFAALM